jgi:hypothetical protein
MAVKVYFDCSWKGPKVEVDGQGKVTKVDKSGDVGKCFSLIAPERG